MNIHPARVRSGQAQKERHPLVVHVVRQFVPSRGGLEDVVANLCRELLLRGWRVRVVTCDRLFTAPDTHLPEHETIDGIEVVRIPWSGSSRYPVAPQVFRHIRDAAIVHVHAVDFFFDALALGRLFHRRPMVATTHGGFFHTSRHAIIKAFWFRTVTRFATLAYDRLIGCSTSDVAQFSVIAGHKLELVENGVDTQKFRDMASPVAAKRLVTIGRFSVNKRLYRLLDAMKALAGQDPDWRLDIIGSPSDFSENDLRQAIAERGLGHAVSLFVSPDNATIAKAISKASFFVSASDYEGFGLVAIEAMSAGLVALLQPNDAYRALASRHSSITLCNFDDPDSAARTITRAYGDMQADPVGQRARMIEDAGHYGWSGVADRYIDIYRDILR